MNLNKKIIIIGAGAAGIAAATRLLSHGFRNLLILEAESRYGGRINTIPFGENVIDMGAQWYPNQCSVIKVFISVSTKLIVDFPIAGNVVGVVVRLTKSFIN